MFILSAVPLILCAVVSVETLSYRVAVLMVSNRLLYYNSGVDVAAALCVCCKEKHCAVMGLCGLKVYQGQKSIEDFPTNMGTVLYQSTVCTNGLTFSKVVAQV
jgi:hypothetical protein